MLHQVNNSYEKTLDRIHVWKISMCTYVKELQHISQTDEYQWIHVIAIYHIKKKQGKLLFVIQYQWNVSVSLPLASVNTNV